MSVAEHAAAGAGHGAGHREASYGETPELIERRQRLGVLLFIGGDAIFVLMLVFTYFYLRGLNVNDGWLPVGVQTASIAMTWTIAGLAAASAAIYVWGASGGDGASQTRLRTGIGVALLLLVTDLVLQLIQLTGVPFHATDGAYASAFLVMAGYHSVHLIVAIVIGLGAFSRASRGLYGPGNRNQVRLISYIWVWVAISAILFAVSLLFTSTVHVSSPVL